MTSSFGVDGGSININLIVKIVKKKCACQQICSWAVQTAQPTLMMGLKKIIVNTHPLNRRKKKHVLVSSFFFSTSLGFPLDLHLLVTRRHTLR